MSVTESRTDIAKRRAKYALMLFGLLSTTALVYWAETIRLVRAYDEILKFVGLIIGPVFAGVGFFWNRLDRAELMDLAEKLGQAKEAAAEAEREAKSANEVVVAKEERIKSLEQDLRTIADSSQLWQLGDPEPFPEYRSWKQDREGAKVVTFGLFKGGVGKTHLAANFAAYVSEKQQRPVLLVDLDYQGSLSAMVMLAAGIEPTGSLVDDLFAESADLATLCDKQLHLVRQGMQTSLNRGRGLSRAWLVPAEYTLAVVESQLLVDRVMKGGSKLDERYRLAHLLLNPEVRRRFGAIVLDTPPRMTLGTINAFVASHYYVVPTILDRVSSEAVKPFLTQVETLKRDLKVKLELAAIVPSMSRQAKLSEREEGFLPRLQAAAEEVLGAGEHVLTTNIPRKTQVTDQPDLGYFLGDGQGRLSRFYDPIFDQIWERIHSPA